MQMAAKCGQVTVTYSGLHSTGCAAFMKTITILGASGSIGTSALKFLRLHRDKFALRHIAVSTSCDEALAIAREFDCKSIGIADETAARNCEAPSGVTLYSGEAGLNDLAAQPVDIVLGAVTGSCGLPAIMAAIKAGNRVALANKESLVCGGPALLDLAASHGVEIIPIDSEHSAMFQCLLAGKRSEVHSIILTASGGPFRNANLKQLNAATPEQALNHPNWDMGPKNSLDSATLANKGLELIEAAYLFDARADQIEVVIHPTSIFHSAVRYNDGSMIAQLGAVDMCGAIGYGLSYPDRMPTGLAPLDLPALGRLEFYPYDKARFPALDLARQSLNFGQGGSLMFNAANEMAGKAFLSGGIGFMDIARIIETCLDQAEGRFTAGLDDVVQADAAARDFAQTVVDARINAV